MSDIPDLLIDEDRLDPHLLQVARAADREQLRQIARGPARTHVIDVGFETLLPAHTTHDVEVIRVQQIFRGERLYIGACNGVTLDGARVGNDDQPFFLGPISTLFYSVPVSPKTLARIERKMRELKDTPPPATYLGYLWEESVEPEAVMGLPVKLDVAHAGWRIGLLLTNHSNEEVRLFGVLRGQAAMDRI